ncbi:CaiB/BaiF CoA transferase family protein [Chloroflexota bacterium]
MNGEALSGLKVVEYAHSISGPYCGKLLADLGAEVIKVEKPGSGEKARGLGPFPRDIPHPEKSGLFLYLNANKLGVTLNLDNATGIEIFRKLVKQADVVIENNPPGEMERLGLDYDSLHKINPAAVVTSITLFGQTGPYRDYKGCDLICLHMGGEAYGNPQCGVDDIEKQPPLKPPGHAGDFLAGLMGATCTMSAVIARQATGTGQHVDLSEQEAIVWILTHELGRYVYGGTPMYREKTKKTGIRDEYFPCKDGYFLPITMTEAACAGIFDMIGYPDWTNTEIYDSALTWRENLDILSPKIAEWTRERTVDDVLREAQARRIPCSPVPSAEEVFNSEQLAARDFYVEIDHKEAGKLKYPGAPSKLTGTPWRVKRPAPLLGEHNEQVYCQMLGYTKQDLAKMNQDGVI